MLATLLTSRRLYIAGSGYPLFHLWKRKFGCGIGCAPIKLQLFLAPIPLEFDDWVEQLRSTPSHHG